MQVNKQAPRPPIEAWPSRRPIPPSLPPPPIPPPTIRRRPTLELSLTGQPRSWQPRDELYRSVGYRGARWGMGVDEVRAVIGAEHPAQLAALTARRDPATRTLCLELVVPMVQALSPGPGPVLLSYVFGTRRRRLVAVHLRWMVDGDPPQAARLPLVQAATRLAAELVGYRWSGMSTLRGAVRGDGTLLLFGGRDGNGGSVEVRLDGVAIDVERPDTPGRPEHRPAPRGPASLRLSFVASVY